MNDVIKDFTLQIAAKEQAVIIEQLNELISRGIIVVERTMPQHQLSMDPNSDKYILQYTSAIRLVPKEFEYIKKLEAENKDLNQKLETLAEIMAEAARHVERKNAP